MLGLSLIWTNPFSKFEVPSFTRSDDMTMVPKLGHVRLITPRQGRFVIHYFTYGQPIRQI